MQSTLCSAGHFQSVTKGCGGGGDGDGGGGGEGGGGGNKGNANGGGGNDGGDGGGDGSALTGMLGGGGGKGKTPVPMGAPNVQDWRQSIAPKGWFHLPTHSAGSGSLHSATSERLSLPAGV